MDRIYFLPVPPKRTASGPPARPYLPQTAPLPGRRVCGTSEASVTSLQELTFSFFRKRADRPADDALTR